MQHFHKQVLGTQFHRINHLPTTLTHIILQTHRSQDQDYTIWYTNYCREQRVSKTSPGARSLIKTG